MNLWYKIYDSILKHNNNRAMLSPCNEVITYRDLGEYVINISSVLKRRKYKKAGILCSHPYNDALAILAAIASDQIAIPMSIKYGEEFCTKIINESSPDVILCDDVNIYKRLNKNNLKSNPDFIYIQEILNKRHPNNFSIDFKNADDNKIAFIMFTSGTTGKPKGVMLSHKNIISNIEDIDECLKLIPDDNVLVIRPLSHASVLTRELLYSITKGCFIIFYSESFSPKRILKYAERVKSTFLGATPSILYNLALSKTDVSLSELKKITVSGECLQKKVHKELISRFPNIGFYNVYGLTETSPQATYLPPAYFISKPCSVGLPLRSVQIMILDGHGREIGPYKTGEIIIKGPNVMAGYYNDVHHTNKVLRNGWLFTGDLGYKDEDGFIYIKGRKDNMIIRAGVNIYPQEIEAKLLEDPLIGHVMVYGKLDPLYGQKICLKVVPRIGRKLTEYDVSLICKRVLPAYKRPNEIHIVNELSTGITGKLKRA